ncbi:MAG TPA: LLM class flavin-dependent oxidoreductase [Candidatus Dormibacteraeota bacterium]|nr:LLM class flavin-dependent oxidoreductase [Candidatus Dormibacteraeota bacterium]
MPDRGRPLRFGSFLTPDATRPQETLRLARLADDLGLDLIGVQDHPYQSRFLDTWTLLSVIAARTERVTVFPDVANLPLRSPALLAKAAASLDRLTGGRVELGLGAGAFPEGIAAMGGTARRRGEAMSALEEAIGLVRLVWSGRRGVRFEGRFYRLRGLHTGPTPAHPMGIWLGTYGPRGLAITGRLADGWVPSSPYAPPEALGELQRRIDEAALAVGRDPAAITRVYNVFGHIGGNRSGPFEGPVAQWVERLTQLALDQGMDSFLLGVDRDVEAQLHLLAEEVAPQVRQAVDRARAHGRA